MIKKIVLTTLILLPLLTLYFYMSRASSENIKNLPFKYESSDEFFSAINKHRTSIGVPALIYDEKLCPLAKKRVETLKDVDWDKLGHYKFEEDANAYAVDTRPLQENIGRGPNLPTIIDGLLNSKGHREAIESKVNVYTCVATDNKNLFVQIFAGY